MEFQLSDEQLAIRDSVRRFIDDRYDFSTRTKSRANSLGFDPHLWRVFTELGWLGLGIGEDLGGLGAGPETCAIVIEELERGLVVEPVFGTYIAVALLSRCAGETAAALLANIGSGDVIAALALLETGGRYEGEPAACQATASDGAYRIKGRKLLARDALGASRLIISARCEDGETALLIVETPGPDVTVRSYPTIGGGHAGDIDFSDAPAMLLAKGADADQILSFALDFAAIMSCAAALGAGEKVIEITAAHVKQRSQFGRSLAEFQVVQHRLAEMYTALQLARSQTHRGLWALSLTDPDARACQVSAAKYAVPAAAKKIAGEGIQLHGAMGMADEHPAGHYYRRAVEIEQLYGSADFHLRRYMTHANAPARKP